MRQYTVPFAGKVEETVIVDWVDLIPAANKSIEVCGLFIGQSSDFGDAQAEIIPFKVSRGFTTVGSGGSAPTPVPLDPNDPAASFTARAMDSTVAKEGTETIIHQDVFNVQVGEKLWLPEGFGWRCTSTQTRLVIRPLTAPVDALTITGTVYVKEV